MAVLKKHLGELDNKYCVARFKKIASYIHSGKLLDVGGYTGELKKYLPPNVEYYLIDRDEEAIKHHNGKVVDLHRQDISELFNFKFDAVVTSCMLDIVLDPARLLEQVRLILKEEGQLIVSIDNDNNIYHRVRFLLGKGVNKTPFSIYYHLRHPTFKQWFDFLDSRFKRAAVSYTICFNREMPEWFDRLSLFLANFLPNLFARGAVVKYDLRKDR